MVWPADTILSRSLAASLGVLMASLLWQGCAMTPAVPVQDSADSLPETYDTSRFDYEAKDGSSETTVSTGSSLGSERVAT